MQTLCFSRMLYKRKQCCTPFKILLLLPQPYLPLPILMKVLIYLTECYLRSNWSSQLWAPFLIATAFQGHCETLLTWLYDSNQPCTELPKRLTDGDAAVWSSIPLSQAVRQAEVCLTLHYKFGLFLIFLFQLSFFCLRGVSSQMLFIFRTSSCCDHLTLNETSVAAIAFYTLNVNFSVG